MAARVAMVMVMVIVDPAQASNKLGGTNRMLISSHCDQKALLDRALQRWYGHAHNQKLGPGVEMFMTALAVMITD